MHHLRNARSALAALALITSACVFTQWLPANIAEESPVPEAAVEDITMAPPERPDDTAQDGTDNSLNAEPIEFPLPEDATAIDENNGRSIDFQSDLTLIELVDYYRLELASLGLVETESQVVEGWGARLLFVDPTSSLELWVSVSPSSVMFTPIVKANFVYLAMLDDLSTIRPLAEVVLKYPIPEDAEVLVEEKHLSQYATDLSLGAAAAFYRQEFSALALVEMNDTLSESSGGMILFGDPVRGVEITVGLAPGSASPTLTEKATLVTLLTPGPAPEPGPSFLSEHGEYPLPADAGVLNDQVDFIQVETDLTMEEVIAFYRQELDALGLVETSFSLDEKLGGTMNFDEPGEGTVLIVSYVPADEAPFHLRHIQKTTLVTLGIFDALMNP
jgi:hypothetical protein